MKGLEDIFPGGRHRKSNMHNHKAIQELFTDEEDAMEEIKMMPAKSLGYSTQKSKLKQPVLSGQKSAPGDFALNAGRKMSIL